MKLKDLKKGAYFKTINKKGVLSVAEIYFTAYGYRGYSRVLLARCRSYEDAVAVCKENARAGYNAYCDFYINKVYKVVFAKSKKCIDDIVAVYVNLSCHGKDLTFVERPY